MTEITQEAKLHILHDHYKDTCSCLQDYIKQRDLFFLFILIVVTLLLFQVYSPQASWGVISEFIAKRLELASPIDTAFVGSVIWFGFLGLVVRYFQTAVLIERQYQYLHSLEDQLSPLYKNKAFTREGNSYLRNYPLFSDWADKLYKIFFPSLLVLVVITKISGEWYYGTQVSTTLIFNSFIALLILLSTILYLLMVHFGK